MVAGAAAAARSRGPPSARRLAPLEVGVRDHRSPLRSGRGRPDGGVLGHDATPLEREHLVDEIVGVSSGSWETITTVIPSTSRRSRSSEARDARPAASSPANGSSSTTHAGTAGEHPGQRDAARSRRRSARRPARSRRPRGRGRRGRARGRRSRRRRRPPAATSPPTVERSSCSRACWNASADMADAPSSGSPSRCASPSVGRRSPARIQASVDLPDPLWPSTSRPSPAKRSRSTSASARHAHGVPCAYTCPTPRSAAAAARPSGPAGREAARAGRGRAESARRRPAAPVERDDPVGDSGLLGPVGDVDDGDAAVGCVRRSSATSARGRRGRPWTSASSETSSCGARASAAPSARRCSSPPESVAVSRSASAASPTRWRIRRRRRRRRVGMPQRCRRGPGRRGPGPRVAGTRWRCRRGARARAGPGRRTSPPSADARRGVGPASTCRTRSRPMMATRVPAGRSKGDRRAPERPSP